MVISSGLVAALALLIVLVVASQRGADQLVDPDATLDCHRRLYSYKVTQADTQGRVCWDIVNVMSCWGRCDSNEISDWRFPYKRSHHPVCLHAARESGSALLRNCEPGVEPGTDRYRFLQALTCRCLVCRSSEASCQGLRYLQLE